MKHKVTAVGCVLILSLCISLSGFGDSVYAALLATASAQTQTAIPPFAGEQKEILPLPEPTEWPADPLAFADRLIDRYETVHMQELTAECTLRDVVAAAVAGEWELTGQGIKEPNTGAIVLNRPLDAFFHTASGSYAVMVRFKSDDLQGLRLILRNQLGEISLYFDRGIYPAIGVPGEEAGELMLSRNWNDYVYTPGEWACAFLSIADTGQTNCYVWAERDPGNFNYNTSYSGDAQGGGDPFEFSMELGADGETVSISDVWLFSYERMKR